MANVASTYGLKPVRKIDGSPFINAQNRYRIASNETVAIFQGDAVQAAATGTIVRHTAANGERIVGVFNGCFYTDPTTSKPTWKNYYPGSIVASDIMAFVIDDPSVVYKIDVNNSLDTTFIFANYDVTGVTGSTTTGISKVQLDRSTVALKTTQAVRIIDVSQDPDNSDQTATNVKALVVINNHFYVNRGAGI
tara:strand:+ start:23 stop:601 length:579 start_codon:yes stop_codon:yes gene_type:complete